MDIKPDIRFTKLHTAKGTFYSFEIFIGYEKTYFGKGKTIKEAATNLYKQYNESIDEIDKYLEFLDKFGSDINANEVNSKINEYHLEKGDVPKRQCLFCGSIIENQRRMKFCSDVCRAKYGSRKNLLKNKSIRTANANKTQA